MYLHRQDDGLNCVKADTGCTIALPSPRGATVQIGTDRRRFSLHRSRSRGESVEFDLERKHLGSGQVWIRVADN